MSRGAALTGEENLKAPATPHCRTLTGGTGGDGIMTARGTGLRAFSRSFRGRFCIGTSGKGTRLSETALGRGRALAVTLLSPLIGTPRGTAVFKIDGGAANLAAVDLAFGKGTLSTG